MNLSLNNSKNLYDKFKRLRKQPVKFNINPSNLRNMISLSKRIIEN